MRVDALWPHLPTRWRLDRTDAFVALDKPSQVAAPRRVRPGSEPADGNDVLTRMARAGLAPAGVAALRVVGDGVGGRGKLRAEDDALASGVVLVAMDEARAEELARLLARDDVLATYLVGVQGWPLAGSDAEAGLCAGLRTEGVAARLVEARPPRGGLGPRALVELRLPAAGGMDVVELLGRRGLRVGHTDEIGPALDPRAGRGGEAGRRIWHRAAITAPGLAVQAPTPTAFAHWLDDRPESDALRMDRALRRRYGIAHGRSDAIRLRDDEHELVLERYGDDLVVAVYGDLPDVTATTTDAAAAVPEALKAAVEQHRAHAARLCRELGLQRAWLKLRPRQANVVVDAVAAGLVPKAPVWVAPDAEPAPGGERIVEEDGVRYWVDLSDGLQTGLFLDQRDNRRWLREFAADRRVLNTFSYTCAFQVAAAVGGARRTVSIDASARALERGRRNLALNGRDDPERHDTIRGDVFHWLPRLARRGDRFDIVVLDPPSYARVRKRRFSAARDYAELVVSALELLAPGGTLLASVNHAGVDRRRFEQMIRDGCRTAGRPIAALQHRSAAMDHPAARMKAVLVELAGPR
ncbi:MAG: hypothetical protein RIT45_884 [Pseudomonadota bacterium]